MKASFQAAAGIASHAVGDSVGPGRIQVAVTRPGRVESITAAIIAVATGEEDSRQRLRSLERAVIGDIRLPDEPVLGVGRRVLVVGR